MQSDGKRRDPWGLVLHGTHCCLHPCEPFTYPRFSNPAQPFSDVFPHLITATNVPKLVKIDDVDYSQVDAIFCCLPHATTQVRAH